MQDHTGAETQMTTWDLWSNPCGLTPHTPLTSAHVTIGSSPLSRTRSRDIDLRTFRMWKLPRRESSMLCPKPTLRDASTIWLLGTRSVWMQVDHTLKPGDLDPSPGSLTLEEYVRTTDTNFEKHWSSWVQKSPNHRQATETCVCSTSFVDAHKNLKKFEQY